MKATERVNVGGKVGGREGKKKIKGRIKIVNSQDNTKVVQRHMNLREKFRYDNSS